jgi:NADH dehydrogenase FAD-containing subunit
MSEDPKQILILGGGFAGVYTARYLEKLLRPEEASITLINRENYWVYQPMLPEHGLGLLESHPCGGLYHAWPPERIAGIAW